MTLSPAQLVAYYAAQAETDPGLALSAIDAALAAESMPVERRSALSGLRREVQAVLNEQALLVWLDANGIAEHLWPEYELRGGIVYFAGVAVDG